MPVVLVLLAVLIVVGAVVVGTGRGGELARERPEAPEPADFRTWSDVAGYRPPPALLGYHAATTERALSAISRAMAERDAEIAWLRSRLSDSGAGPAGPAGPRSAAGLDEPAGDLQAGPDPAGWRAGAGAGATAAAGAGAEPAAHPGFSAQQAPVRTSEDS